MSLYRNPSLLFATLALAAVAFPTAAQSSGKGSCCPAQPTSVSWCIPGADCCKPDATCCTKKAASTRDYLVQNGKQVARASQVSKNKPAAKLGCCGTGASCCTSGCCAK